MIKSLDEALMCWQASLVSRRLYGPDHASVQSNLENAHRLLSRILETQTRVQLIAIEDRVVCGNEALPSSRELLGELFGGLAARGVTSISIESGLQVSELSDLAAALGSRGGPVSSTAHVRLGCVQRSGAGRAGAAAAAAERVGALHGDVAAGSHLPTLQMIWGRIETERDCAAETLLQMVTSISAGASPAGGMLLPLATLKAHNEYTFAHAINVALMSSALGEELDPDPETLIDLTGAALLHDIGKVATPERLLNKPGKLDDRERRIMQRHPVHGAAMLLGVPNAPRLGPIVAFEHHIALDGTGYPRVRRGWRPNLASQVVQIADIFDALRTNRPYRPALPMAGALEIMTELAGRCFDRTLWTLFLERVVTRVADAGGDADADSQAPAA